MQALHAIGPSDSHATLPLHGCAACRETQDAGAAERASPDEADRRSYLCWGCRNSAGTGESSCVFLSCSCNSDA